jgi:uncharacterized LabA/DUF88 family protein
MPARTLVFIDEANLLQMGHLIGKMTDWARVREFLGENRSVVEFVVYAGLPPNLPEWFELRQKRDKFLNWLEQHGFLVVRKFGKPAEAGSYKATVDLLMAIDAIDLCEAVRPEEALLVSGDGDFSHLALKLRRKGIRVTAAGVVDLVAEDLKSASNDFLDMTALFQSFGDYRSVSRPLPAAFKPKVSVVPTASLTV